MCRFLFALSFLLFSVSHETVAQQHETNALFYKLHQEKDGKERLSLLLKLSKKLYHTSPDTALTLATEALTLAQKLQRKQDESTAYYYLGKVHYYQGHYANAIGNYKSSLAIDRLTADTLMIETILNELGRAYRRLGDNKRASEYFIESMKMAEAVKDAEMIGVLSNNLGLIFSDLGNDSLALHYYRVSLATAEAEQDSTGIALSLNNIASHVNNDEAKILYTRALHITEKINDNELMGMSYSGLGSLHEENKDYNKAIACYLTALDYATKSGIKVYVAEELLALSDVYFKIKDYTKSIRYGQEALNMAKEIESGELRSDALFSLAAVYEKLNQSDKAIAYLKTGYALRDSLVSLEKTKAISNLEANYQLEKKEVEIKNLNLEKAVQKGELKRASTFRDTLLISLITFIGLSALLVIVIRKNKHITRLLRKQKGEIEVKNNELQNLNLVKDKIFSSIAHDFRSPLHSIHGVLSLLQHDGLSKEELMQITESLSSQVHYTSSFLENLLNWSRSQMEMVKVNPVNNNIKALVEECFQLYWHQAVTKNITLKNNVIESCTATADPEMMKLILRNLISNAIKFTSADGEVTATSKTKQDEVLISVTDNGMGIPDDVQKKIFTLEAGSTPGTAREKGIGLGLYLCKDFIEKNGGKIWVSSEAGKGTTFTFTVPTIPPGAEPA
jgi:signal transduction histidine kinase